MAKNGSEAAGAACGCVTNAGYEIAFFYKFTTKAIGIGTRRAADPMWTGMRTRGLAHPAAPDTAAACSVFSDPSDTCLPFCSVPGSLYCIFGCGKIMNVKTFSFR